ncbi:MAG TPA: type II toxin-antitoxin system VapC family toxin [Bryobacteraceae bacterium]|nr:type II toxin-antitoxin system VapC family toxin [Bryobacteraceae bacterium]
MTLVDANTIIHYLKGREPVVSHWQAASPRELAIPSVAAYEILYGIHKRGSPRRQSLGSDLLADLEQIPFDRDAARESARIRVELEGRGLVIGPMDLLIAGTALSRGAVLVTNNTKEFSRIKGLQLSDWTK